MARTKENAKPTRRRVKADRPIIDEVDPGDDGLGNIDEETKPRSVVSADRKREFQPSDLSLRLSAAVADGQGRTDPEKLRAFAVSNGVWDERYAKLNVGMQRMNVGVRLRSKVGRGEKVKWRLGPSSLERAAR